MPQKINLTKRAIEALKPPKTGRTYYYDLGQANLAICITASGARTFYRTGRVDGRAERIVIGRFPDLSVENARKAARTMAGDIARGVNPKRLRDKGGTVEALFRAWLSDAKLRKRSWPADEANFDFHFGPIATRKYATLTREDVAKWFRSIGSKRGTVIANRCRALLSAMFNQAGPLLGYEGLNPCDKIDRYPEQSRERFLQANEVRPFFEALKAEPPAWRDYWLLVLFTGSRRSAVAEMVWSELDLVRGLWMLPGTKTKNKKPQVIVLTPEAVVILQTREAERNGSGYVFPGPAGHIIDPRKSWARVVKAAGLDDLHPHDLRRTLGSWQALAGTSLQVIGASLGHVDHRSTQVYSRLTTEPVRQSVTGAVAALVAAGEPTPARKPRKSKGGRTRKEAAAPKSKK